ncbi:hypothetical protein [Mycolicibacterium agri]|uniref:Uncharacterized protein n=1 Tax=Mycolicibacterium agri TaxID=36811 RepID=A0A7I9VYP4_MYCAG|nr:hypothetical protein [Mycolicibacterium agri]GFG50158.1 hypothetical protein MAGR_15990 [Mycolicibacterium agri]
MASYNCTDSTESTYGAGGYGTCAGQVGAPNTGLFPAIIDGGFFTILVPLAAAIVVVVVASILIRRRKKA